MAMTTNQDYGYISALITIYKYAFIYTETISEVLPILLILYLVTSMLSKYPFDKHVSYFFSAEMVKRGKGWSREKEPWSPFILQPIVCLKILHFHMKAIIEKTTQKMVNWRAQKTCKKWHTIPGYFLKTYMFFFLSKIIPIKKSIDKVEATSVVLINLILLSVLFPRDGGVCKNTTILFPRSLGLFKNTITFLLLSKWA